MITTLVVIGVVAMLSVPVFFNDVDDSVLEKQRKVFLYKFNDGLESMKIDDKLSANYSSTEDFVNVMKKHFKITSICDKNNLQKCFPKEFTYTDNYTISYTDKNTGASSSVTDKNTVNLSYITANLKTTSNIASVGKISPKFNSNVMGIVFSDDARMLITYNPDCTGPTTLDNIDDITDMTKCFSYIADINANKAPNEVKRDIITNMQLADTGFEIASVGILNKNVSGCLDATQATGDEKGSYTCDYWLGAKKYCENLQEDGGGWRLPNAQELKNIAEKIYGDANCSTINNPTNYNTLYQHCDKTLITSSVLWQQLAGRETRICLWEDMTFSNAQSNDWAYHRCFYAGYSGLYSSDRHYNSARNYTGMQLLCVK